MGYHPPILDIIYYPITVLVMAINIGIFIYQKVKGVPPYNLGISPTNVIQRKEYWRLITATFTHDGYLHIIYNSITIWNLRLLEFMGLTKYMTYIVILTLSTGLVDCIIRILINRTESLSVGFSAVLFGLMTLVESSMSAVTIFGISIPWSIAPFLSLFITYLMVPQSSFIGHSSGIIIGYLISWGFFEWITPTVFWSLLPWTIFFFLINYKLSFPNFMSWLKISRNPPAPRQIIVNGRIVNMH